MIVLLEGEKDSLSCLSDRDGKICHKEQIKIKQKLRNKLDNLFFQQLQFTKIFTYLKINFHQFYVVEKLQFSVSYILSNICSCMMEANHTKCLNVLFQVFGLTTFTQKSIKFDESKTSVMEIMLIIYNLILIVFTSAHFTVLLLIHPIFDSILIYNSITILAYLVALM